ncbi:MAG: TIGR01212 family radical SAM protein, partial [Acholeplasmatales bacterium]|nr:TIGR01212 family radical SAM protein [Acholeplasmatales bacterium]
NYYLNKYHEKVAKISLNAGFSCPNKDGTKGYGGCSYCSRSGSGDFAGKPSDDLKTQFEKIKEVMVKKWPHTLYIPYLQANTNTYAEVSKLEEIYTKLISLDPNVVQISIATRADCLENEKIALLSKINKIIPVQIELGLQTSNEKTASLINRGSSSEELIDAVKRLRRENIEIVIHIINGLPGEDEADMLNTIEFINKLDIQGIKIHSLCILKNTKMGDDYIKKPWPLLSLEEYVKITVEQIRHLREDIIIHRLSADADLKDLIAPLWTRKKLVVMNEIDKLMRKNNYYQGDQFKNGHSS